MTGITAIVDSTKSKIQVKRPKFYDVWFSYPRKMAAPEVYYLVGGQAFELYKGNPTGYANACALRLSRAFNYGGVPLKQSTAGYHVKGEDGKPYLLRVTDMIKFVEKNLGKADLSLKPTNNQDLSSQLKGKQGIIIFKVTGWNNATGHVTLWNGYDCGDSCYFIHSNPNTTTNEILFWNLR